MEMTRAATIDQVLDDFRQGRLTEAALRQALANPPGRIQNLLYLQASSLAVTSSILGMTQILNGQVVEAQTTYDFAWPYANVLEAIRDGWRVIKFPELALLVVPDQTTSLGCEFVLEKWS